MPKYKIGDIVYVNMTCTQECRVTGIREHSLTGEPVYDLEFLSHWFMKGTRAYAIEKLVYATREEALEKALCQK